MPRFLKPGNHYFNVDMLDKATGLGTRNTPALAMARVALSLHPRSLTDHAYEL